MSAPASRSYLAVAAAIVIAGALISAALLAGGTTTTKTVTATTRLTGTVTATEAEVSISTVTRTSTVTETVAATADTNGSQVSPLCSLGGSAADILMASATNCPDHLALTLEIGNATLRQGANMTVTVSVANALYGAQSVAPTGYPVLPDGVTPAGLYDYTIPRLPLCGLGPAYDPFPAFVTILNSSGSPLALDDLSDEPLTASCTVSPGTSSYQFAGLQSMNGTTLIGGYWSAPAKGGGGGGTTTQGTSTYTPFSPGQYTIVAFDEFGDYVTMPFTVTGPA
ncbi:MAG: hypothetical protein ABSF83_03340 [Nitrososphaerales archaeon]